MSMTSTLLCSPPTPSSAAAPVVIASGLPRCGRSSPPHGAFGRPVVAGDISTPAPHKPALSRGETRVSQVPGPSSSCVPWSSTPPGRPPLARSREVGCGESIPGHPETWTHGSLARVPTLRRIRYRLRRQARYRPGGLTLGRGGSHPLDDKQGFMKSSHTPFRGCLVACPRN